MDDKVYRILSGDVSVRVEEPEWKVGAGEYCKLDILLQFIVLAGNRLRSSKRTLVVRVADVELIVYFDQQNICPSHDGILTILCKWL